MSNRHTKNVEGTVAEHRLVAFTLMDGTIDILYREAPPPGGRAGTGPVRLLGISPVNQKTENLTFQGAGPLPVPAGPVSKEDYRQWLETVRSLGFTGP